jgi:ABC-2 type transport system permease protein
MNREQLKTILWLRWRLMCNQSRRSRGLGAVIAVLVGVSAILLAVLSFLGALIGAAYGLGNVSPQVVMWIWFGVTVVFLFFWMIGLLTELQRSETIDLQKLMHLPVALGQMFVINYFVSHFTLSIIFIVPAMLGLGIGLVISRGPEMILLVPLALSMVFMVTAWTYCLRGWLATMMSNPRRRRTIIMCISLTFVLLSQGPNLYFNVFQNRHSFGKSTTLEERQNQRDASTKEMFNNLIAAQRFVPPLWVPVGAQALAEGNPLPAALGTLGCLGLGALGLRRAYRSTVRFYLGETGGMAAVRISGEAKKIPVPRDKDKTDFLERSIPFVPEQSAALALATLRSLSRAPEVKMTLATTFIVTIILGATFFLHTTANLSDTIKPFVATGSIVFSIFFLAQFFNNQFGFDRDGFRSLILSPADRRLILIGKNLAGLPVAATFGLLLVILTAVRLHLPVVMVVASLFQLVTVLLIAGLAGNLLSILMPFRIQPGTMKPTKMPGLAILGLMLCQFLFPLMMSPVFIGPLLEMFWRRLDLPDFVPINLIFSTLLCGLMIILYWQALAPLGRLLHRREIKILGVITVEVE